jgi:hypothetical protein
MGRNRRLPQVRCGDDRTLRRFCRQVHGRWGARLFRLPERARGRRRADGARQPGGGRCRGSPRLAWLQGRRSETRKRSRSMWRAMAFMFSVRHAERMTGGARRYPRGAGATGLAELGAAASPRGLPQRRRTSRGARSRGAEEEGLNHQVVSFKSADTPAMPGILRKSTAFVPRYQKFESISLQQTVCLSPAAAFEGREPGFPRGFGRLAWRPGQQRLAGGFDIASTGGNISVGPYSSTAVRLVVAPGLTRGRSVDV